MDPEDFNKSSPEDTQPVGRIDGPPKKLPVKKNASPYLDMDRMRAEAWNAQRRMQQEHLRNKVKPALTLENITAAADLELAKLGFPYALRLEQTGAEFNWVLLHLKNGVPAGVFRRSERLNLAGENEESLKSKLKYFIKSSGKM